MCTVIESEIFAASEIIDLFKLFEFFIYVLPVISHIRGQNSYPDLKFTQLANELLLT